MKIAFVVFTVLVLVLVFASFFAIPFAFNDYDGKDVPMNYQYRIMVRPDYPYNSEYLVLSYLENGDLIQFTDYFQAPVDDAWPSARVWGFISGLKSVPTKNVISITSRMK